MLWFAAEVQGAPWVVAAVRAVSVARFTVMEETPQQRLFSRLPHTPVSNPELCLAMMFNASFSVKASQPSHQCCTSAPASLRACAVPPQTESTAEAGGAKPWVMSCPLLPRLPQGSHRGQLGDRSLAAVTCDGGSAY